jgi:AbrB family looped-hinge helix DNA binding protein
MARSENHSSLGDLFYGSATLGERGQIVIPSEARKRHGLEAGDKLLVFRHPHVRGIVLARVDDVQALMKELQEWVDRVSSMTEKVRAKAGSRS